MIIFLERYNRDGILRFDGIYLRLSIVPKFSTTLSNDVDGETKERNSCLTLLNESKLSINCGLGMTSVLRQYFSIVRTFTLRAREKKEIWGRGMFDYCARQHTLLDRGVDQVEDNPIE